MPKEEFLHAIAAELKVPLEELTPPELRTREEVKS